MEITVNDSITLRTFEEGDTEALFALLDNNRAHVREWLGWVDDVRTSADTLKFIQSRAKEPSGEAECAFGIWHEGKLAGVLSVHALHVRGKWASLGYWLGKEFEGKGIMIESCRALINYLFKDCGLNRVEIYTEPSNEKSWRIAERLGFTHVGMRRHAEWHYDHFTDHKVYDLLRSEWKG